MKDIILFGWFVVLLIFAAAVLIGSRYPVSTATAAPPTYVSSGKCDSPDTVATLKDIALRKIHGPGGNYLIVGYTASNMREFTVSIDSFRKRHMVDADLGCAAMIKVHATPAPGYYGYGNVYSFEISTEYTIETTTDGKTIVSARFSPNS